MPSLQTTTSSKAMLSLPLQENERTSTISRIPTVSFRLYGRKRSFDDTHCASSSPLSEHRSSSYCIHALNSFEEYECESSLITHPVTPISANNEFAISRPSLLSPRGPAATAELPLFPDLDVSRHSSRGSYSLGLRVRLKMFDVDAAEAPALLITPPIAVILPFIGN